MSMLHSSYEFLADILAKTDSEQLLAFKVSNEMKMRYLELIDKNKKGYQLSREENEKLHDFLALNRIISLAKVKAENPSTK